MCFRTESMTPCSAWNPSLTGKKWSLLSAIVESCQDIWHVLLFRWLMNSSAGLLVYWLHRLMYLRLIKVFDSHTVHCGAQLARSACLMWEKQTNKQQMSCSKMMGGLHGPKLLHTCFAIDSCWTHLSERGVATRTTSKEAFHLKRATQQHPQHSRWSW